MNYKDFDKKLRGFRPTYKNRHIALRDLSDGAFRLHELLIDICDWDPRHNNFGLVNVKNKGTTKFIRKGRSTLWRRLEELENAGLITKLEVGWYRLNDAVLYNLSFVNSVFK